MNLRRIATKGLKGLSLFPDAVAFDFDQLPQGLVAVIGPNGAGKSTFLELPMAALYGQFPSRAANSLIDSVDGKDAYLDVELAVDGKGTYRARVNVDAVGRKTDGVLELTTADGSRQRLNDGKISTFDDAVRRELPAPELVLASAYAAQGREGSFATLGRKERKDLFAQLLGLEQYERWAQTARDAGGLLERRLTAIRAIVARLQAETTQAQEDAIADAGNALQADLTTAEQAEGEAQRETARLETAVEAARAQDVAYTTARQASATAQTQLEELRAAYARALTAQSDLTREAQADLDRIDRRRARAVAERTAEIAALVTVEALEQKRDARLADIDVVLTHKRHLRDQKIANNRDLIDRKAAIAAAVAALVALEGQLVTLAADTGDARVALQVAERAVQVHQQAIAKAGQPEQQLAHAREQAGLIATTPFGERCAAAQCQFIALAVAARAQIPTLEQDVAAFEQQHRVLTDLEEQLGAARQRGQRLAAHREALDREIAAARAGDAALQVHLAAAEEKIATYEAEKREAETEAITDRITADREYQEAVLDLGRRRAGLLSWIEGVQGEAASETAASETAWERKREVAGTRVMALLADISRVTVDVKDLSSSVETRAAAHEALLVAETAWRTARTTLEQAGRRLTQVLSQVEAFELRREAFKVKRVERALLEQAVTVLQTEQIEWATLARIFGRDGLPVLEIDAAGPGVSALANDLLQACFGARFTVELITQDAKVDGKGLKEVFELRVWDSERDGDPRDIADLSGGERVIVEEALRSSIALYVNQRNVQPIRNCWRDETVGALDADNAVRYVQMLRRIQVRGGFTRVFFISHNPDASALADAQIYIHDGKIDTLYPPFAAAPSEAA